MDEASNSGTFATAIGEVGTGVRARSEEEEMSEIITAFDQRHHNFGVGERADRGMFGTTFRQMDAFSE